MNKPKYIGLRLLDGMLYGVGIAICYMLVYWGIAAFFSSAITNRVESLESSFSFQEYDEKAKLEITEHREQRTGDGNISILGKIHNAGNESWENINIEVELFGDTGKFLGEYTSYINRTVCPNQSSEPT
jgi:hypothetical protein